MTMEPTTAELACDLRPPAPFPSWTWDDGWHPPVPQPEGEWTWDEDAQAWTEMPDAGDT